MKNDQDLIMEVNATIKSTSSFDNKPKFRKLVKFLDKFWRQCNGPHSSASFRPTFLNRVTFLSRFVIHECLVLGSWMYRMKLCLKCSSRLSWDLKQSIQVHDEKTYLDCHKFKSYFPTNSKSRACLYSSNN